MKNYSIKNQSKLERISEQSNEQFEIFVTNQEHIEEALRDRLFLLAGCNYFGERDNMVGLCVDCCIDNKEMYERCVLFQDMFLSYRSHFKRGE